MGVRRATRKAYKNVRLGQKALALDKKAAVLTKKSEKAHSTYDLGVSNKKAVKAANYDHETAHNLYVSNNYWKERVATRGKEYSKAKAEYYRTPIGKVSKAASAGRKWLENLF